ncbi:MAG: hypothetical protein E5W21_37350, partial [Mesorhizobium sp.]
MLATRLLLIRHAAHGAEFRPPRKAPAHLLIGEQTVRYCSLLQHSPFCVCVLCRGRADPHIGVDSGEGRTSQKGRSKTMLDQIKGLHHVTSMASDARLN